MVLINEIQFVKQPNHSYVILNLITGAADIIDEYTYKEIVSGTFNLSCDVISALQQRRYIFESDNDYLSFLNEIDYTIDHLEKKGCPNFVLVPSYACNLCCTYCYERTYSIENKSLKELSALVDKQFHFIDNCMLSFSSHQDVRITIMGGEPLLAAQYSNVKYIIDCAEQRNYTVDVVTNGVELDTFIPLLTSKTVDHIQVTLDGVEETHDKRRVFHNGNGSFKKIIKNIEAALKAHINVYLRVNLDAENIESLPLLAQVLSNLSNREHLFPYLYLLQDGGCSGDSNVIHELAGIEQLYALEQNHPELSIFAKRYHPMQYIDSIFNNKKFSPCLRHCGASKNQYILDCNGLIYKCWHGIGNERYACGKYLPELKWNTSKEMWSNRSVKNLNKCSSCKYRYICGTGCPAAKHSGTDCFDIEKESCVEYEELIEKLINIHLNS